MSTNIMFYSRYGKRVFDLALTIPELLVISPALLLIALLVRIRLGRPVLFKQTSLTDGVTKTGSLEGIDVYPKFGYFDS